MNTNRSKARRGDAHLLTAVIWTAVTFFATVPLLFAARLPSSHPDLLGHILLLVSGWTMVSSWRQYAQRQTNPAAPLRHPFAARLWIQTLWGPLALCAIMAGVGKGANRLLWHAIAARDLPAIHRLRSVGVVAENGFAITRWDGLTHGLLIAIERQDVHSVEAYLAAGANPYNGVDPYNCSYKDGRFYGNSALNFAVHLPSTAVTRTLLRSGASEPPYYDSVCDLISAVDAHQSEQVRLLLHSGVNVNAKDHYIENPNAKECHDPTALSAARSNHDAAMIKLLQEAGAK